MNAPALDRQADCQRVNNYIARFGVKQIKTRELWTAIYTEFEQQQPPMTVRQMFYRMSSTGAAEKSEAGYRQVQHALTVMREKNAIPYYWLADNTRYVSKPKTYNGIADMFEQQKRLYRRAYWTSQPVHVEIWLEKDALRGVLDDVTSQFDVPLYVTRGFPSITYLYTAAESLRCITKPIFIYHFGDYDASGKDAARSIREGLRKFGASFHFEERAITEEQITRLNLQTRPAKKADPRSEKFGDIAVELDAIAPADLRKMVLDTIMQHVDIDEWLRLEQIEIEEKATLDGLIGYFGTSTKSGGVQ